MLRFIPSRIRSILYGYFFVPISFLFFALPAKAQTGQLFYELLDNGQCTSPLSVGPCQTFSSTCSTGWVVSNGTPELIPTNGWACSEPCMQGTAVCDPTVNNAILMVANGSFGEGLYKPFYFQGGLTYKICVFYSMVPNDNTQGGTGTVTFAAKNGLTQNFAGCQSQAPSVNSSELIGTASSGQTFATFTYSPIASYSQFLMYATSTVQNFTAIVTGIQITVVPTSCISPAVIGAITNNQGNLSVTWPMAPGVRFYEFTFSNGTTSFSQVYVVSGVIPTGPFPVVYNTGFQNFPTGAYTVSIKSDYDLACTNGTSPPSTAIPVSTQCLSSPQTPFASAINGGANVNWFGTVSGATSYTINFIKGGTDWSFTAPGTSTSGNFLIPTGTYTVIIQAKGSCGVSPLVYAFSTVTVL